ncbi:MAG: hypothetical protein E6J78_08880 [Deltaproteobacteria bacterium]|nr:MAG: hypothetical protein E6J78_08880 [Deltaproteobacteria bacterium]
MRQLVERFAVAVRLEQHLGAPDQLLGRHWLARAERAIAPAGALGRATERPIDPGGAVVRPRLFLVARRSLRIAGDEMRRRGVGAHFPEEDRLEDLLDALGRARTRDMALRVLPRPLEQHLVGIDVAERDLPEQPLGAPAIALVDGAESGHVQRAIGERPSSERELLEELARRPRLIGGAERERLDPASRAVLGRRRQVVERVLRPSRLQLAESGLEHGRREVRRQTRRAESRPQCGIVRLDSRRLSRLCGHPCWRPRSQRRAEEEVCQHRSPGRSPARM